MMCDRSHGATAPTHEIIGKWLHTKHGKTMHWDERDIMWLVSGGIPYVTEYGYITLPYGNTKGKETYPWRTK